MIGGDDAAHHFVWIAKYFTNEKRSRCVYIAGPTLEMVPTQASRIPRKFLVYLKD